MLGTYQNFPDKIHFAKTFVYSLSKKILQRNLIQVFKEVNNKTFSFEEICNPSIPNSIVVFEFGIADTEVFSYIDKVEAETLEEKVNREPLKTMDFFCGLRYYKNTKPKRTPLKFDYYMFRMIFGEKQTLELSIYHEKGPRYILPEDLAVFIENKINGFSQKKVLKPFISD
jgi:hypothetical protein